MCSYNCAAKKSMLRQIRHFNNPPAAPQHHHHLHPLPRSCSKDNSERHRSRPAFARIGAETHHRKWCPYVHVPSKGRTYLHLKALTACHCPSHRLLSMHSVPTYRYIRIRHGSTWRDRSTSHDSDVHCLFQFQCVHGTRTVRCIHTLFVGVVGCLMMYSVVVNVV